MLLFILQNHFQYFKNLYKISLILLVCKDVKCSSFRCSSYGVLAHPVIILRLGCAKLSCLILASKCCILWQFKLLKIQKMELLITSVHQTVEISCQIKVVTWLGCPFIEG